MSAISGGAAQPIAAKFPGQNYRSVIDIGCAEGAVPVQIALTHKHITGGGFDLRAETIEVDASHSIAPKH
jgi:2-polyprenyl-3-methyl-5-hydroxy-6-metoxy-1,4-benzoquinol methylase